MDVFKNIDYKDAKELKIYHTANLGKLSKVWGSSGCGRKSENNPTMPLLADIYDITKPIMDYREWTQLLNQNISVFAIGRCHKILSNALKEQNIFFNEQDINEMIYLRICYEGYVGYLGEKTVYDYIKTLKNIKEIRKPNGKEDFYYGIDFIVECVDKTLLIQVKPITFLTISLEHQEIYRVAKQKISNYAQKTNSRYLFVYHENGEIIEKSKYELKRIIEGGISERPIVKPFRYTIG